MNKIAPTAAGGGKGAANDDAIKLSSSETEKLLGKIRKRFTACVDAEAENRKAGLEDVKFKAGDQWPGDVQKQRAAAQRPCLTINRMLTLVHQVTNNLRQNRPQIKVNPVGDNSDRKVALMYSGLIRAIERDSSADIAYDTGADQAATMGWGFWRVDTEYESPDSFNQVLVIRRVRNAFTVYLDPNHQEPDGADSKYGFVTEMIPRDEFEAEFPDANPMPFGQGGIGENYKEWADSKSVRVAEYFEVNMKPRTLVALDNGHVGWKDELDAGVKAKIASGKIEVVKEREAASREVSWYKVSATDVLDSRKWPGEWIPIVKVIGDEMDVEGKVKYSGVVRFAKDSQRMYNYFKTSETESVALAPKAKWLVEEGQVADYLDIWRTAHTSTDPVLPYKAKGLGDTVIALPTQIPPPPIDQSIQGAIQGAAMDMMATTGIQFDANQQELRGDASGKAVRELSRNTDVGSFHYMDNFTRSLRHTGRILIDLIPKIYDTKRMVVLLRDDDKEEQVQLNPNAPKPATQGAHPTIPNTKVQIFNPMVGRYGVTVTTGPSFATKRIEAAEQMMTFVKALPNTAGLLADLIAKNMDWPGADEMARRLAKAVPPQLMTPDNADIPPQVQAVLQNMDQQIKQMMAERQQMIKALTDKQADRDIEIQKVNKDFEVKLLAVIQKAEQSSNKDVGSALKDLASEVVAFNQALSSPPGGVNPGDTGSDTGNIRGATP